MSIITQTKLTKVPKAKVVPDLSLTRDPAEIWPKPESCPDFPLGGHLGSALSKQDAELRLKRLCATLNGPTNNSRTPTIEEREKIELKHFRKPMRGLASPQQERLAGQGFPGLIPIPGSQGHVIAEALHLRGHIRKLEARETSSQKDIVDTKKKHAERAKARFDSLVEGLEKQIPELLERTKRYTEHLADQQAYHKVMGMRDAIEDDARSAQAAAQAAEVDGPRIPDWVSKLPQHN